MKSMLGIALLVEQALKSDTLKEEEVQQTIIRYVKFESWKTEIMPYNINILQYLYYTFLKQQKKLIFSKEEYEEIFKKSCFQYYVWSKRDQTFAKAITQVNMEEQLKILKDIDYKCSKE